MSVAVENFVKNLYKLQVNDGIDSKTGSLARILGITPAAATDMARKLAVRKLIQYEKYQELELTSEGRKLALDVIRKHRIWETFLYEVLGLSLHEIHREAELLEHQTSGFLVEKLSAFLGHPEKDPHGDPIPLAGAVEMKQPAYVMLTDAVPGKYKIRRLTGNTEGFFDFCKRYGIQINRTLNVLKRYNDGMIEVHIGDHEVFLHEEMCQLIFVEKRKSK